MATPTQGSRQTNHASRYTMHKLRKRLNAPRDFLRKTVALVGEQPYIHLVIERLSQLSERLPKDYTARNGHVERMFGARLGDLDRTVAQIDCRLIDAKYLIAKD